jgi:hypothetical protein
MTRLRRALAAFALSAGIVAGAALGCRAVLGIEDRGDDALTCDAYCTAIAKACTGDKLQYESNDACMKLCATFPVGTTSDMSGNTLGCRLNEANALNQTGDGVCAAAGPGGDGICGSNCESFCTSVAVICPGDFKSQAECRLACARIPDAQCPAFFVVPDVIPNVDSIQCRIYHLSAATINPMEHCPHTLGVDLCVPVADGGVPCTDAGTGGGGGGGGGEDAGDGG